MTSSDISQSVGAFESEIPTFGQRLAIQKRVLAALLLRELKTRFRVGTSRIGYLWVILETTGFLVVFTAGFALMHASRVDGIQVVPFLITGFGPFLVFKSIPDRCLYAIESNKGLLAYSHVKPLDFMIARAILELFTFVVVMTIIFVGAYFIGMSDLPEHPVRLLGDVFLAAGLGFGLGLIVASVNIKTAIAESVYEVIARVMFVISGEFYVPEMMPQQFRQWVLLNPLLDITEAARASYTDSFTHVYGNYTYPVCCTLVLIFIGLIMERAVRKDIEAA